MKISIASEIRAFMFVAIFAVGGCQTDEKPSPASPPGGSAGWLRENAALQLADRMRSKNMLPAAIQCRVDGGTADDPIYAAKVKWVATDKAIRWTWTVGNDHDVAMDDAAARSKGLRMVSKSRTVDKRTNMAAACAIWQS